MSFPIDSTIVSGTLTWMASPSYSRTAVTFYLTLTLLRSQYPNITLSQVGMATITIPGVLKYGDGYRTNSSERLTVQAIDEASGHMIASVSLLHNYPTPHHYGDPWCAV